MQGYTKPGLESQMKELDMYPEDQYFQKYTFESHQHQRSPGYLLIKHADS